MYIVYEKDVTLILLSLEFVFFAFWYNSQPHQCSETVIAAAAAADGGGGGGSSGSSSSEFF